MSTSPSSSQSSHYLLTLSWSGIYRNPLSLVLLSSPNKNYQSRNRYPRGAVLDRPRGIPSRREDRADSKPRWDSAPCFLVGWNDGDFARVSFFPHDGLGAGVAMGLAFYQEGMVMKQNSIEHCLPLSLLHTESLPFTLRWPGYTHIKATQPLPSSIRTRVAMSPYGRIAQQVSQVFSAFIQ
ncbi:hypothetical protein DFH09DRAFT_1103212, partial [Mycena vulgaris]